MSRQLALVLRRGLTFGRVGRCQSSSKDGPFIKSGNVLGNRIPLTNLKLLVMARLIQVRPECYGPLLCKVSGARRRLFKHEDDGFGPKMAKRLEEILGVAAGRS